jgi:hypothetical protein
MRPLKSIVVVFTLAGKWYVVSVGDVFSLIERAGKQMAVQLWRAKPR